MDDRINVNRNRYNQNNNNTDYDASYQHTAEMLRKKRERRRYIARQRVLRQRICGLGAVIVVLIILIAACHGKSSDNVAVKKASSSSEKGAKAVELAIKETANENADDLSDLESQINEAVKEYDGDWSVYVKNLDTDTSISIDNRQIYAASLIKLYAMSSAFQQVHEGLLKESDTYDTVVKMIDDSDNTAFNSIVWSVGNTFITSWCNEYGYNDTLQCHGLYPADNADGLETSTGYNLTSVNDCGKLLESIYRGQCVSKDASQKMMDILLDQNLVTKIPAGVPEGVKVANKTGETGDVCHDAAIVFSDGADYIITVMVEADGIAYSCSDNVVALSRLVYNYFNK